MDTISSTPSPPPRALIRAIWRGHRLLVRLSGARLGLPAPGRGKRMGMMRVHAIGRNSGEPRPVVLGYFDDGDALVTLAMNGWAAADPSWLKNLRATPRCASTWAVRAARSALASPPATSMTDCGRASPTTRAGVTSTPSRPAVRMARRSSCSIRPERGTSSLSVPQT